MKKSVFTVIITIIITINGYSQQFGNITAIDNLLQLYAVSAQNGAQDAEQILTGYLSPLMKGIGFGMASGWVNTAATHKPGGFDFSISLNTSFIPVSDYVYTIGPLKEATLVSPGDGSIPTIFGRNGAPTFQHNITNEYFDGAGGMGFESAFGSFIPTPMVQAGIGVIPGTDVKIRFMPPLKNTQYGLNVNMLGIGGTHDLTQYIPDMGDENFKISAFAGFTRFNFNADLSDAKDKSKTAAFHVNSITVQAIASKTITIFTLYASGGVTQSLLNTSFKGGYSIDNDPSTIEVTDPLDMTFGSLGPRGTLGLQMKFIALTMNMDYTFQKYNTLSVGLGISIK
ncbi:MAG: hypothetical protein OEW75_08495 [Cyclobacteriaceae bacterium]|nr:hypothetical protein [Cyclobacteriaceae bacterium]